MCESEDREEEEEKDRQTNRQSDQKERVDRTERDTSHHVLTLSQTGQFGEAYRIPRENDYDHQDHFVGRSW